METIAVNENLGVDTAEFHGSQQEGRTNVNVLSPTETWNALCARLMNEEGFVQIKNEHLGCFTSGLQRNFVKICMVQIGEGDLCRLIIRVLLPFDMREDKIFSRCRRKKGFTGEIWMQSAQIRIQNADCLDEVYAKILDIVKVGDSFTYFAKADQLNNSAQKEEKENIEDVEKLQRLLDRLSEIEGEINSPDLNSWSLKEAKNVLNQMREIADEVEYWMSRMRDLGLDNADQDNVKDSLEGAKKAMIELGKFIESYDQMHVGQKPKRLNKVGNDPMTEGALSAAIIGLAASMFLTWEQVQYVVELMAQQDVIHISNAIRDAVANNVEFEKAIPEMGMSSAIVCKGMLGMTAAALSFPIASLIAYIAKKKP